MLWAEDFTINNPRNSITNGRILFHADVVIVMGHETVKPVGKAPSTGQTVNRRYTHFLMKRQGHWLLTARHANIVVQANPLGELSSCLHTMIAPSVD